MWMIYFCGSVDREHGGGRETRKREERGEDWKGWEGIGWGEEESERKGGEEKGTAGRGDVMSAR